MVDVTLEIMLEPASHDLSYNLEKAARRYRRGDILAVHRSADIATLNGNEYNITEGIGTRVFGYIHIRDVPSARARLMRDVLIRDTEETKTVDYDDPLLGNVIVTKSDVWRLRRWRIPASVIPAAARAKLLIDRELTVSWATFRDKIRRKNLTTRLNPALDDESVSVQNSDLP